jgi:hypothetical protein
VTETPPDPSVGISLQGRDPRPRVFGWIGAVVGAMLGPSLVILLGGLLLVVLAFAATLLFWAAVNAGGGSPGEEWFPLQRAVEAAGSVAGDASGSLIVSAVVAIGAISVGIVLAGRVGSRPLRSTVWALVVTGCFHLPVAVAIVATVVSVGGGTILTAFDDPRHLDAQQVAAWTIGAIALSVSGSVAGALGWRLAWRSVGVAGGP